MGSFLSRTLLLAFGYAYPAYECFKAVEKDKPEIEQLRFWCQYWILVAVLTVCGRIGDVFISWLPLYNEAKLALVIYLWHSNWKGTAYVYNSFLRPYVVKHVTEVDGKLFELKLKAREVGILYWHRAMNYGRTRSLDILQHLASQNGSDLPPDQQQQNLTKTDKLALSQASASKSEQLKQPLPDSSSLSVEQPETNNEPGCLLASQSNKRMVLSQYCVKTASQSSVSRVETGTIQPTSSIGNGNSNSSQEQTPYKEAVSKPHGIWRIFKTAAH